jgi:hypothetical protein
MHRLELRMVVGLVLAAAVSAACSSADGGSSADADSSADGGSSTDGGSSSDGFGPYAGLDEGGLAVATETRHAVTYPDPGQVHAAPDGTVWVWRGSLLEHYSAQGLLLARTELIAPDEDGGTGSRPVPSHVVFHPSGEITVAVARYLPGPTPDRKIAAVELRRLSPAADEIRRVLVRGEETLTLPEFYQVEKDGTFALSPGATVSQPGFFPIELVADDDGGLYATDRFRLFHLDADDSIVATTWLVPNAELPVQRYFKFINEKGETIEIPLRYSVTSGALVVDHAHRVWVALTGPSFASAMLGRHYGEPVELGDDGDVFLVRFSPSLTVELAVSLPAPNGQYSSLLQLAENTGGAIGVAAWSEETREIEPNKSFDYNVRFAMIDADGRKLAGSELDFSRDDEPMALSGCGDGFCIGGITDSKWVDTGSQVDFAKGFILKMRADGQRDKLWTLHGPRNNYVSSLSAGADGSVFFTAVTNGPITHTDPSERYAETLLGRLQ